MNNAAPSGASVFILYRQPDYDAFFSAPDYDGAPAPDEGAEWQLSVHATRESADVERAEYERRRMPDESVVFVVDEYRLGELHWLSGFFVDQGE